MTQQISIIFLGTSQAIPTEKRNHTSILLNYKDENILIDCGEGTQRQFRKAHINPCKLTRILITHWHGDHVLGLPGLMQTLALNGYNKTLQIYGPRGTKKYFQEIINVFVFDKNLKYKVHEILSGRVCSNNEFEIESISMEHGTPTLAYSFEIKEKLRIDKTKLKKIGLKGELIGELAKGKDIEFNGKKIKFKDLTYKQEGRKISFILDTKLNSNCFKIAENSDLLICESSYSDNEKEIAKEYHHLTTKQAAEIAKKSKSKKLILTHISQRYENSEKMLVKEAREIFKNSEIAEDLMKVLI